LGQEGFGGNCWAGKVPAFNSFLGRPFGDVSGFHKFWKAFFGGGTPTFPLKGRKEFGGLNFLELGGIWKGRGILGETFL